MATVLWAQEAPSHPSQASLVLRLTLQGIASYGNFREIRAALAKSEKMEKVSLVSEAPGLITFDLRYAGEPKGLIEELQVFFPKKYSMKEKNFRSGGAEIIIRPGQSSPPE